MRSLWLVLLLVLVPVAAAVPEGAWIRLRTTYWANDIWIVDVDACSPEQALFTFTQYSIVDPTETWAEPPRALEPGMHGCAFGIHYGTSNAGMLALPPMEWKTYTGWLLFDDGTYLSEGTSETWWP